MTEQSYRSEIGTHDNFTCWRVRDSENCIMAMCGTEGKAERITRALNVDAVLRASHAELLAACEQMMQSIPQQGKICDWMIDGYWFRPERMEQIKAAVANAKEVGA